MATSIWDVVNEGASNFDIYGNAPMVELSYDDRAAISAATESDVGFVEYINQSQELMTEMQSKAFACESVSAIRVAQGMDCSTAMEGLKTVIKDAWEAIKRFLAKIWETIKEYVKKAKDYVMRRLSLGKAMLTKYSDVLRNKKVDSSIKFKWAEVDIEGFAKNRKNWMDNVMDTKLESKIRKASQELQLYSDTLKTIKNQGAANVVNTKIRQIRASLKQHFEDLGKTLSKDHQNQYTTVTIANEMDRVLYKTNGTSGEGQAKYEDKSWSEIQDAVMKWADLDATRYLNEALGIFEKDSNSLNKLVNDMAKIQNEAIDEIDDPMLKRFESSLRLYVKQMVQAATKIHKMYIYRLKSGIDLMQTQAISAARKAILAKGTTTEESYSFENIDFVY